MLVGALLCASCLRDRRCSAHPVFPAPSVFEGKVYLQNSGRIAPRDQGRMSHNVMARSASDDLSAVAQRAKAEAIHSFFVRWTASRSLSFGRAFARPVGSQ